MEIRDRERGREFVGNWLTIVVEIRFTKKCRQNVVTVDTKVKIT